jgi:hypothetical protein
MSGEIVLHTRTAIEYRDRSLAAILPGATSADDLSDRTNRLAAERAIDDVLADSFPASDPPSWNPGITRLSPVGPLRDQTSALSATTDAKTFLQGLTSLAGAAGIALLVPFGILLVGLPVALAVRGLLEAIGWVFGVTIR